MDYYFGKGLIKYKNDWIIVEVSDSIVNYYKFWVEKFTGKKVSTPLYRAHITVVPGKHEPGLTKHPLWGKYQNKTVDFKYYSEILTDHEWFFLGKYFWLKVECPFIHHIRTELGLKPNLKWAPHVTICYRGY